ncbi:MAG: hypothetical protein ACE5FU_13295, partial [Nitrospinota bacterium]
MRKKISLRKKLFASFFIFTLTACILGTITLVLSFRVSTVYSGMRNSTIPGALAMLRIKAETGTLLEESKHFLIWDDVDSREKALTAAKT